MSGNVRGGAAKAGADTASPLVVIVEDDEGVREGLQDLLRSVGLDTLAYGATSERLAATLPEKVTALDARLDAYLKEVSAQMAKANPNYDPATAPSATDDRGRRGGKGGRKKGGP